MFKHKVVGALSQALLPQFISYYEMGDCCLLLGPNLSSITNLAVAILLTKWHELLLVDMDKCTALELIIRYHFPIKSKIFANVSLYIILFAQYVVIPAYNTRLNQEVKVAHE